MNESTKTNLRQADAIIRVEGVLSEKALEVRVEDGKEVIKGTLTIQTSDINFVTFSVNVGKLTKDNKENKLYAGMLTVLEQYKSIAEVGNEGATKIRVTDGQLNPYTYFNESGRHDVVGYKSNFFNRIKENEDFEPKAEFEVEVFIQSIVDEVNSNEEQTGRLLVKGLLPTYNGIEPVEFVVPENYVNDFNNIYEIAQTVRFCGDIVNSKVVKTIEIPAALGKPRTKKTTTYKNELVIDFASMPYEESDHTPPYEIETIKKAMVERDALLKEREEKAKSGNNSGTTSSTATQSTKAKPSADRKLPW